VNLGLLFTRNQHLDLASFHLGSFWSSSTRDYQKCVKETFCSSRNTWENLWGSGLVVMNFNSQLPELHHLTCCLFETWHVLHFLYWWLSPCFTSSTLTVRSVPTGCTGRVFLALRGKHSAPLTTPPTYEVSEFERLGVPHFRVIITVLPHPDHAD
jgi:hypothetical protein